LKRRLPPEMLAKVHRTILDVLATSEPAPQGSFAAARHDFEILLHRYSLQPKRREIRREIRQRVAQGQAAELAGDAVYGRLIESATASPIDFLLPRWMRNMLYPRGIPGFGLRAAIRTAFALGTVVVTLQSLKWLDGYMDRRAIQRKAAALVTLLGQPQAPVRTNIGTGNPAPAGTGSIPVPRAFTGGSSHGKKFQPSIPFQAPTGIPPELPKDIGNPPAIDKAPTVSGSPAVNQFLQAIGIDPALSAPQRPVPTDIPGLVNWIVNDLKMTKNFTLQPAAYSSLNTTPDGTLGELRAGIPGVSYALSLAIGNQRYLLYNPVLAESLSVWEVRFIMAHEIAHFYLNHPVGGESPAGGENAPPKFAENELAADLAAAAVLKNMGATLDEALAWVNHSAGQDKPPYPDLASRINAVRSAWQ
jgi:hypothetical protein